MVSCTRSRSSSDGELRSSEILTKSRANLVPFDLALALTCSRRPLTTFEAGGKNDVVRSLLVHGRKLKLEPKIESSIGRG